MEIDASKDVYLFVHGRNELVDKATKALVAKGFQAEKITEADSQKTGQCWRLYGNVMDASKSGSHQSTADNWRGFKR